MNFNSNIPEGAVDPGSDSEPDGSEDQKGVSAQEDAKSKHKRRSKADNQGRDFTCGCGKKYLSYPALYTHVKTKHGGVTPSGTTAPVCATGRLRGRPKKVRFWSYFF